MQQHEPIVLAHTLLAPCHADLVQCAWYHGLCSAHPMAGACTACAMHAGSQLPRHCINTVAHNFTTVSAHNRLRWRVTVYTSGGARRTCVERTPRVPRAKSMMKVCNRQRIVTPHMHTVTSQSIQQASIRVHTWSREKWAMAAVMLGQVQI